MPIANSLPALIGRTPLLDLLHRFLLDQQSR